MTQLEGPDRASDRDLADIAGLSGRERRQPVERERPLDGIFGDLGELANACLVRAGMKAVRDHN
jgi:hypothetical protein